MRGAFLSGMAELAELDPRIVFLTGDLGFMAVEPFAMRFPDRFINVGVAEQNMVGVATGLAEAGFIPFVYSIVPFAALRPYEFIRNGPVVHRLPVRIVGIGTGFEYSHNGVSHYGLEDAGIMRLQPDLTVVAPADKDQARNALMATWSLPGPVYYRLGKDDRTVVPGLHGRYRPGRAEVIREGGDLLFVVMGSVAVEVAAAAELLAARGVESTVMVVAGFNPAPVDDLLHALARFPIVLTVEAHYAVGGIGSLVSEVVADHGLGSRVVRCGVERTPDGVTGSQDYLYERHGLSRLSLANRALIESGVRSVVMIAS